jgi:hypothetical protein
MPSSSKKQHNFMAAVAKNPAFAKKVGIKQSVGEDFIKADKGRKFGSGGTTRPDVQSINKPKTQHGKMALFNKGGDMKPVDMKKNPGVAKLPTAVRNKMGFMKKGGMAMFEKSGKDVEKKGMKEGSKADMMLDRKQMMGMKKGGMAEGGMSDTAQDKAMIKKAFKQHDMQEHKGGKGTSLKLAKGGSFRASANGIATKGKTKGTIISMKRGGKTC